MRNFLLLLLVSHGLSAAVRAEPAPLRIHLVSGSKEYQSETSLKAWKTHLESTYRITCSASWATDGATELEDLDQLAKADLLLIFARRLKLGEKQLQQLRAHWEAGKPVVGLRTAGHAFSREVNEVFDKQVMGTHYDGHFGDEPVQVRNHPEQINHPVLAGVGPFTSAKLYKTGKDATATVLQVGDIGKAKHPVSFVHEHKGGRVFFSSLGLPADFKNEHFRRLLTNAICWTTRRSVQDLRK